MQIKHGAGFTLIELSIVLVIIGLIIGGVLTGRDLIEAAAIRAQITQLEKYNMGVNAFRLKYGALPGDITPANASQVGLIARGGGLGDGDGDGFISAKGIPYGNAERYLGGENVLFWTDLTIAQMIGGNFNDGSDALIPDIATGPPGFAAYLPPSKISPSSYITVYGYTNEKHANENSWQIIEPISSSAGLVSLKGNLTPIQCQAFDQKIDDGLPTTGVVAAMMPPQGVGTGPGQPVVNVLLSGPPFTDCVEVGPPTLYNTTSTTFKNSFECSLRIKAQF